MSVFLKHFSDIVIHDQLPVHSPLSLLAVAVIGSAVNDQRALRHAQSHWQVQIAASWLQLADVDPRLLESEGVEVDNAVNLHWQFG